MPAKILPNPGGDVVQDKPVDTDKKQGPGPLKSTPPSTRDSSRSESEDSLSRGREGAPVTAGAPERRELPPKLHSKFLRSGRVG